MVSGQAAEVITNYSTVRETVDSWMTTGCCTWTAHNDSGRHADEVLRTRMSRTAD